MPIEIFMPALSPTMEEGNLAKWLVAKGDKVEPGDIIAEIETDKATMEVEAADEGTVGKIIVDEGTEGVPVGDVIAVLLEEGEDEGDIGDVGGGAKAEEKKEAEQKAKTGDGEDKAAPEEKKAKAPADKPAPGKSNGATVDDEIAAGPAPTDDEGNRIKVSPLARRIAKQKGIDLSSIEGSGPKGRIVKRDLEEVKAAEKAPEKEAKAPPKEAPAPADYEPPADIPFEEIKLSTMRKVIARRMTESKTTVPHFYLTVDCEVDKLLAQRKELNAKLADSGVKISVNDFVIKAVALALKKVPAANAMYAGEKMYRFERQDISVAVAIEGGLVTPVIRDAGSKGLAAISEEMKELAAKARDGKLMPEDYQGGTFSISNLGMFGIKQFEAVINPPQGAILAVGAGEQRAVVKDGAVAIATVMSCTIAVDHRAMDGAIGAEFLAEFKKLIEDPVMMLL